MKGVFCKGEQALKQKHRRHFVQPAFYWYQSENKNALVLVAAAGSATTGSLELPALGADVGPGERHKRV